MGTKIPLIKISGKRIRLESIIIWEGERIEGDAKRTPKEAKQKEASIIPITKGKILIL